MVTSARKGLRLISADGVDHRWSVRRKPTYSQGICQTPLNIAVPLAEGAGPGGQPWKLT